MGRNDFRFTHSINCRGGEGAFLETIVFENRGKIFFDKIDDGNSEIMYKISSVSQEYIDYVLYEINKFKENKKKMNKSIQ